MTRRYRIGYNFMKNSSDCYNNIFRSLTQQSTNLDCHNSTHQLYDVCFNFVTNGSFAFPLLNDHKIVAYTMPNHVPTKEEI